MSNKFKDLIKKHKISQSELARIIEVSRPTVIKILAGEREIRKSEADKLAMNLGISTSEIFGETAEVEVILEKKSSKKNPQLKQRISVPARNVEKFKNALLYITQKIGALHNVGQTVLYKILYFCDFDYYEKYEEEGGVNQKRPLNERPFGFKFLCILLIAEAFDDLLGHACVGEASVVEEVLHSDIFGKVREHTDAVVCTSYCAGVAKWRHLL